MSSPALSLHMGSPAAEDEVTLDATAEQLPDAVNDEEVLNAFEHSELNTRDYYMQKYKREWEIIPEFRDWLRPSPNDDFMALCRFCNVLLRCHKAKLYQHCLTGKHRRHVQLACERGMIHADAMPAEAPLLRKKRLLRGRRGHPRQMSSSSRPADGEQECSTPASGGDARPYNTRRRRTPRQWSPFELDDVSYADSSRVSYTIGLGEHTVGFIGASHLAQAIGKAILDKGLLLSSRMWVVPVGDEETSVPGSCMSVWRRWGVHVADSVHQLISGCDLVFVAAPLARVDTVFAELTPIDDLQERCFISVLPELSRTKLSQLLSAKMASMVVDMSEDQAGACSSSHCADSEADRDGSDGCTNTATLAGSQQSNNVETSAETAAAAVVNGARARFSETACYHVVRLMTNVTARTGHGCCGYAAPAELPHVWLLCVEVVCGALGYGGRVSDDQQLDDLAAAFCGAPAFTVEFADALALSAASVNVAWHTARKMVAQTLIGVGEMLLHEGDPAVLTDKLATPGSAVIPALAAIQRGEMRSAMIQAVKTCRQQMSLDK